MVSILYCILRYINLLWPARLKYHVDLSSVYYYFKIRLKLTTLLFSRFVLRLEFCILGYKQSEFLHTNYLNKYISLKN